MTNAELIKALRNCSSAEGTCAECSYKSRVYPGTCNGCKWDMMHDAADALEADEKRIDGLQKLVDINTERCEALRKQLREAHENYEKHINGLEAQMPKEGEWIREEHGHVFSNYYCSKCGAYAEDKIIDCEWNYCPNCGARMRGANDE